MNTLIISIKNNKNPKFGNAIVTTFEEEYEKYKVKCTKKQWRSPEGFSLEFDSLLQDLRECVFVRPISDEEEAIIRKQFKILEEYDSKYI